MIRFGDQLPLSDEFMKPAVRCPCCKVERSTKKGRLCAWCMRIAEGWALRRNEIKAALKEVWGI